MRNVTAIALVMGTLAFLATGWSATADSGKTQVASTH
jgi:hypothetical protein